MNLEFRMKLNTMHSSASRFSYLLCHFVQVYKLLKQIVLVLSPHYHQSSVYRRCFGSQGLMCQLSRNSVTRAALQVNVGFLLHFVFCFAAGSSRKWLYLYVLE